MAQYSTATIVNNGDPRTELDIVIVGDGYTFWRADEFTDKHFGTKQSF